MIERTTFISIIFVVVWAITFMMLVMSGAFFTGFLHHRQIIWGTVYTWEKSWEFFVVRIGTVSLSFFTRVRPGSTITLFIIW